ncbi:M20 aminoacylase family protein [Sphingomonas oryzagri]|uniref:M20 aminoacylase family protein n=1 Tax=Sphingomonas oryzagri TaxID=3042314 RepID=A0ABT6MYS3_9SPHN|nr:M20 aminoacylase family protein [Sphingomonas oryzagri]MDH7637639.1 M20 aminoacylase family protein [Sphingomonas oryzagri]
MALIRRDIHAHPELAFEEHRTSDLVARALTGWGIAVERGIAGTGLVATLSRGDGPSIGLRADMDALPVDELGSVAHKSRHAGRMHACGHDGHTAMLLGAARELAADGGFHGTVHFIFQPAEECDGGGRHMVEDGLFARFPCDQVFGIHNWPGLPLGAIAVREGAMMASFDTFEILVQGKGAHAAMPEQGHDPVVAGAALVSALQTVASRIVTPNEPIVLSVTQFHAGDAYNVIPQDAVLRGTVRCFSSSVRDKVEAEMRRIGNGIAQAYGVAVALDYRRGYPATVNAPSGVEAVVRAARATVGDADLRTDFAPSMASEDFSFMLEACPGAYLWLGAGVDSPGLHHPCFDFNDALLPIGVRFWTTLVRQMLPERLPAT